MMLIDSHCHLDFAVFDDDREELLAACRRDKIMGFVVPGVMAKRWPALVELVDNSEGMFGALGLHPLFMSQHQPDDIDQLKSTLSEWHAVAVGEIGLDFYHTQGDQTAQMVLFESQLHIAKAFKLPVILHVRKAHDRTLAILRQIRPAGGIVHAFSGSEQQAKQYIALGFCLGVGGAVTYDRATRLRRTLSALPLSSLVLESDAPDMLPAGVARGERNSPLGLLPVVDLLSDLHQCSTDEIAGQTTKNVLAVLGLPLNRENRA